MRKIPVEITTVGDFRRKNNNKKPKRFADGKIYGSHRFDSNTAVIIFFFFCFPTRNRFITSSEDVIYCGIARVRKTQPEIIDGPKSLAYMINFSAAATMTIHNLTKPIEFGYD